MSLPAMLTVMSIGLAGARFHSTQYPYTISQPPAFRHDIIPDPNGHNLDYFYVPSLPGSYNTGLSIYAAPGHKAPNERTYLSSIGGLHVHRVDWVHIAKQKVPLVRGDFQGLAGHFTIERMGFVACRLVWHVTYSYATDHPEARTTLLAMVKSVHLTCPQTGHR